MRQSGFQYMEEVSGLLSVILSGMSLGHLAAELVLMEGKVYF